MHIFHELLLEIKTKYLKINLRKIINDIPKLEINLETCYELNTTHHTLLPSCIKSKSQKELTYLPYDSRTGKYLVLEYANLYPITAISSKSIYGDYPCKLLLNFINKNCEIFNLSPERSMQEVEIHLKLLLKPCITQKSKQKSHGLCRICYKYCCLTHPYHKPISGPPSLELIPDIFPLSIYSHNWKGKYLYNELECVKSMKWFLSYRCATHPESPPLSLHPEISKLLSLHLTNPCAISLILNIPCPILLPLPLSPPPPPLPLPHFCLTSPKKLPHHTTSPNCTCKTCDESCPCLQGLSKTLENYHESRGYCEKYCSCSYTCPYKFLGCSCVTPCTSNSCVCFRNLTECDPELCRTCKAYQECRGFGETCGNLRCQRGLKKRTCLGRSTVDGAGAGVFSAGELRPGEFINEYTGELIKNQEADRRGFIYDLMEHSFIFGIDCMHSIDATYFGNKMRYINHKRDSEANCYSQVWRVRGTTKVLIFAKKNIRRWEELFFDYKYPESVSYSWYQKQLRDSE